jgi:hypothetical protein
VNSTTAQLERPTISERSAIILLFLFSAAVVAPAIYYGIPENYDLGQHLRFAKTYLETFSSGTILPSWGATDNAGLGSAGVRFYPPLVHMLMGLIQLGTNSWYDTLWMTMFLWMFVGSVGVFKLANEWLPVQTALLSAGLYAIVPYHLLQVFQAFLLAEFAAAAILPFCFLFAFRLARDGGAKNVIYLSAAYSLLVLSHIPSTIMGSLSLAVFVGCYLNRQNIVRTTAQGAIAVAISLAATAFYWVRMVTELPWVKHNTPDYYASGFYDYTTYLFPMFLSAGEVYGYRFLWLLDICIVITYLLLIPAFIVIATRRKTAGRSTQHVYAFTAVALFAFFMMSLLSKPLWDNIGTIQKLQFPYRWLGPASLAAAILFPVGVIMLSEVRAKVTRPFAYSLTSILLLIAVFDITQVVVPSAPLPRTEWIANPVATAGGPSGRKWVPWMNRKKSRHKIGPLGLMNGNLMNAALPWARVRRRSFRSVRSITPTGRRPQTVSPRRSRFLRQGRCRSSCRK